MKTFVYAIRVTKQGGTPKIETGTVHCLQFHEAVDIALGEEGLSWEEKRATRELVSIQEVQNA
jgi:hypothetical protein